MTIPEVITKFINDGIIVNEGGQYLLAPKYYPKTSKTVKKIEEFETLLLLYVDLWPKKIKTGNRLVRKSANSLRGKLKAFTNRRKDVTQEEILEATSIYVASSKRQNYEYMQCADYFISKNNSSELESHIDLLKEGNLEGPGEQNLVRTLN